MKRLFKDKSDFDYLLDNMAIIKPANWDEVVNEEVVVLEKEFKLLKSIDLEDDLQENEFFIEKEEFYSDYDLNEYKDGFMSNQYSFLLIRYLDSLEPWFCIIIEANKIIDVQVTLTEVEVLYQVERVAKMLDIEYDPLQLILKWFNEDLFYDVDFVWFGYGELRNYLDDYYKRVHPEKIIPYRHQISIFELYNTL